MHKTPNQHSSNYISYLVDEALRADSTQNQFNDSHTGVIPDYMNVNLELPNQLDTTQVSPSTAVDEIDNPPVGPPLGPPLLSQGYPQSTNNPAALYLADTSVVQSNPVSNGCISYGDSFRLNQSLEFDLDPLVDASQFNNKIQVQYQFKDSDRFAIKEHGEEDIKPLVNGNGEIVRSIYQSNYAQDSTICSTQASGFVSGEESSIGKSIGATFLCKSESNRISRSSNLHENLNTSSFNFARYWEDQLQGCNNREPNDEKTSILVKLKLQAENEYLREFMKLCSRKQKTTAENENASKTEGLVDLSYENPSKEEQKGKCKTVADISNIASKSEFTLKTPAVLSNNNIEPESQPDIHACSNAYFREFMKWDKERKDKIEIEKAIVDSMETADEQTNVANDTNSRKTGRSKKKKILKDDSLELTFQCETCSAEFNVFRDLKRHMKVHDNQDLDMEVSEDEAINTDEGRDASKTEKVSKIDIEEAVRGGSEIDKENKGKSYSDAGKGVEDLGDNEGEIDRSEESAMEIEANTVLCVECAALFESTEDLEKHTNETHESDRKKANTGNVDRVELSEKHKAEREYLKESARLIEVEKQRKQNHNTKKSEADEVKMGGSAEKTEASGELEEDTEGSEGPTKRKQTRLQEKREGKRKKIIEESSQPPAGTRRSSRASHKSMEPSHVPIETGTNSEDEVEPISNKKLRTEVSKKACLVDTSTDTTNGRVFNECTTASTGFEDKFEENHTNTIGKWSETGVQKIKDTEKAVDTKSACSTSFRAKNRLMNPSKGKQKRVLSPRTKEDELLMRRFGIIPSKVCLSKVSQGDAVNLNVSNTSVKDNSKAASPEKSKKTLKNVDGKVTRARIDPGKGDVNKEFDSVDDVAIESQGLKGTGVRGDKDFPLNLQAEFSDSDSDVELMETPVEIVDLDDEMSDGATDKNTELKTKTPAKLDADLLKQFGIKSLSVSLEKKEKDINTTSYTKNDASKVTKNLMKDLSEDVNTRKNENNDKLIAVGKRRKSLSPKKTKQPQSALSTVNKPQLPKIDSLSQDERDKLLQQCGISISIPVSQSPVSNKEEIPAKTARESVTKLPLRSSKRTQSPVPSTSKGHGNLKRKRTARKSCPDAALMSKFKLKESSVLLKSLSRIEISMLRNPHSSFGKSSWLKTKFDTDSESDMEWDIPSPPDLEPFVEEFTSHKRFASEKVKTSANDKEIDSGFKPHIERDRSGSKKPSNSSNKSDRELLAKFGLSEPMVVLEMEVKRSDIVTSRDLSKKTASEKSDKDILKQFGICDMNVVVDKLEKQSASGKAVKPHKFTFEEFKAGMDIATKSLLAKVKERKSDENVASAAKQSPVKRKAQESNDTPLNAKKGPETFQVRTTRSLRNQPSKESMDKQEINDTKGVSSPKEKAMSNKKPEPSPRKRTEKQDKSLVKAASTKTQHAKAISGKKHQGAEKKTILPLKDRRSLSPKKKKDVKGTSDSEGKDQSPDDKRSPTESCIQGRNARSRIASKTSLCIKTSKVKAVLDKQTGLKSVADKEKKPGAKGGDIQTATNMNMTNAKVNAKQKIEECGNKSEAQMSVVKLGKDMPKLSIRLPCLSTNEIKQYTCAASTKIRDVSADSKVDKDDITGAKEIVEGVIDSLLDNVCGGKSSITVNQIENVASSEDSCGKIENIDSVESDKDQHKTIENTEENSETIGESSENTLPNSENIVVHSINTAEISEITVEYGNHTKENTVKIMDNTKEISENSVEKSDDTKENSESTAEMSDKTKENSENTTENSDNTEEISENYMKNEVAGRPSVTERSCPYMSILSKADNDSLSNTSKVADLLENVSDEIRNKKNLKAEITLVKENRTKEIGGNGDMENKADETEISDVAMKCFEELENEGIGCENAVLEKEDANDVVDGDEVGSIEDCDKVSEAVKEKESNESQVKVEESKDKLDVSVTDDVDDCKDTDDEDDEDVNDVNTDDEDDPFVVFALSKVVNNDSRLKSEIEDKAESHGKTDMENTEILSYGVDNILKSSGDASEQKSIDNRVKNVDRLYLGEKLILSSDTHVTSCSDSDIKQT